ncbi:MAG: hypothetical protein HKN81_12260, partial [Gammaproteobacteria bacterium]|nr:hypothetical protein [Gammaproteobacteria bacterium]
MSVIQGLQNLVASTRVSGTQSSAVQTSLPSIAPEQRIDYLRARTELISLYRAIERLAELTNINTRFKLDLPDAVSSSAIGLDMTTTSTALNSSGEINASPMSFSPFGPDWQNGSDALVTLDGEYLGNDGTGQLTFEARRAGPNLRIRVTDSNGGPTNNITIDQSDPAAEYSLQNGLFFTLGSGTLINRDTLTVQVYDNLGAVVNPDLPLGGQRNENPHLQYGLPDVVDGAFSLNGENISVATTDTINDVLQRINDSDAGVSAVFNALSESIDLLQNTPGSQPTIDFASDTSNFLQVTKLDDLNVVPGIDPDSVKPMDSVPALTGTVSGDILINGQAITIDTSNDSLSTVLSKINNSSAGVVASLDPASQLITIEADDSASILELDSNGTNFFAAINMVEGRVDPEVAVSGISRRRSYDIADAVVAVFDGINKVLRDSTFIGREKYVGQLRAPLDKAVRSAFDGADDVLGLLFDGSSGARSRGDFLDVNRRDFTSNIQRRGSLVREFLAGQDDQGGFVQRL